MSNSQYIEDFYEEKRVVPFAFTRDPWKVLLLHDPNLGAHSDAVLQSVSAKSLGRAGWKEGGGCLDIQVQEYKKGSQLERKTTRFPLKGIFRYILRDSIEGLSEMYTDFMQGMSVDGSKVVSPSPAFLFAINTMLPIQYEPKSGVNTYSVPGRVVREFEGATIEKN